MMDFLKAYPSVTREEYMWVWTVPQIKLALTDHSHQIILSEEEAEMRNGRELIGADGQVKNDLELPVFNIND